MLRRFFKKDNWAFWVLMLVLSIFPALWKVWLVIGWQVTHPNHGIVQVNAPFPWIQLSAKYPIVLERFDSLSPVWGDGTSSARIAPSARTETYATTESWANQYKHDYQQRGITIGIVKQTSAVACVSTVGSKLAMVCRTPNGMILNYQGDVSRSEEAISLLLSVAGNPNL